MDTPPAQGTSDSGGIDELVGLFGGMCDTSDESPFDNDESLNLLDDVFFNGPTIEVTSDDEDRNREMLNETNDNGTVNDAFANTPIEELPMPPTRRKQKSRRRKTEKKNMRKREGGYPKFSHMCGMAQQKDCLALPSEKKVQSCWVRWEDFSKSIERSPAWSDGTGLGLFKPEDVEANSDAYDFETVDLFFVYLKDQGEGRSTMESAKTFVNAHLKCEHYNRLKAAGEYPLLKTFGVGKSKRVQNAIKEVNEKQPQRAFNNCEDLQAELDCIIEPDKMQELLLMVFLPKSNGEVAKLQNLYRIQFGCHNNHLSQTTRRGEEVRPQRLIQRCVSKVRNIGVKGTLADVGITNFCKHNKEGWLEITKALPHKDPIRDSAAWHGLLLVHRLVGCNHQLPNFLSRYLTGHTQGHILDVHLRYAL